MELTLLAGSSVLAVGVGYALVRTARRTRPVVWAMVCASLIALSTRDLFRSRQRGRPESRSRHPSANRSRAVTDGGDDSTRSSLVARLRRRVGGWFG